mmetsp:Transcript_12063/g.34496  ORF Transcript_12063/g.34496 Transcript_12063/m.34496 type:complete len:420 (-) Transcript_12063:473-1732(-)
MMAAWDNMSSAARSGSTSALASAASTSSRLALYLRCSSRSCFNACTNEPGGIFNNVASPLEKNTFQVALAGMLDKAPSQPLASITFFNLVMAPSKASFAAMRMAFLAAFVMEPSFWTASCASLYNMPSTPTMFSKPLLVATSALKAAKCFSNGATFSELNGAACCSSPTGAMSTTACHQTTNKLPKFFKLAMKGCLGSLANPTIDDTISAHLPPTLLPTLPTEPSIMSLAAANKLSKVFLEFTTSFPWQFKVAFCKAMMRWSTTSPKGNLISATACAEATNSASRTSAPKLAASTPASSTILPMDSSNGRAMEASLKTSEATRKRLIAADDGSDQSGPDATQSSKSFAHNKASHSMVAPFRRRSRQVSTFRNMVASFSLLPSVAKSPVISLSVCTPSTTTAPTSRAAGNLSSYSTNRSK